MASTQAGPSASRKEQKVSQRRDARKIDTQQPTAAVQRIPATSTPTPSLPPQLDVEAAIAARKFEITALQKAIKTARASSSTRAWQLLPRHARRRAASHNVLRLPARLRAKGIAELKASTTVGKTRSQIRKRSANHPLSKSKARKDELRERATKAGKRWLETHLWFSKRFRMSSFDYDGDRWGFTLPEEPSMKGERTDWRAFTHKCAIFDASWHQWLRLSVKVPKDWRDRYMSVIPVPPSTRSQSAAALLQDVLVSANIRAQRTNENIILPSLASSALAINGVLHGGNRGTTSDVALCPLQILYPQARCDVVTTQPSAAVKENKKRPPQAQQRRLRHLFSLLPPSPPQSEIVPDAEILLRAHPAAVRTVEMALKKALHRFQRAENIATTAAKESQGSVGQPHFVLRRLQMPDANLLVPDDRATDIKHKAVLQERGKGPFSGQTAETKEIGLSGSWRPGAPAATYLERTLEARLTAQRRAELRQRSYNIFELYGPKAGTVLGKTLRPVSSTDNENASKWEALTSGTKPDNLVVQSLDSTWATCISIRVHDPRLNLPATPKKEQTRYRRVDPTARSHDDKRKRADEEDAADRSGKKKIKDEGEQVENAFIPPPPPSSLPLPELLSDGYSTPHFTKGTLDARRSQLMIPGSRLEPTSKDDCIPILIVPRRTESEQRQAASLDLLGFTVIVPQGWGRIFFQCFMASPAEVRPLGLDGMRNLSRESAVPWFPDEWPSSSSSFAQKPSAWESRADFTADMRYDEWARRPPAKRTNFEKIDVQWPFGGRAMYIACAESAAKHLLSVLAATDSGITEARESTPKANSLCLNGDPSRVLAETIWSTVVLLCSHETVQLPHAVSQIVSRARELLLHSCSNSAAHAFIHVSIEAEGKGSLEDGDEIRLPVPGTSGVHIGSVTTGRFALSRGKSCGMGLVAVSGWILAQAAGRSEDANPIQPVFSKLRDYASFLKDESAETAEMEGLCRASNLVKLSEGLIGEISWRQLLKDMGDPTVRENRVGFEIRSLKSGLLRKVNAVFLPA